MHDVRCGNLPFVDPPSQAVLFRIHKDDVHNLGSSVIDVSKQAKGLGISVCGCKIILSTLTQTSSVFTCLQQMMKKNAKVKVGV